MDKVGIERRVAEAQIVAVGESIQIAQNEIGGRARRVDRDFILRRFEIVEQGVSGERGVDNRRREGGQELKTVLPREIVSPGGTGGVLRAQREKSAHETSREIVEFALSISVVFLTRQAYDAFQKEGERLGISAGFYTEERAKIDGRTPKELGEENPSVSRSHGE